jgi:hypothetical protein
MKTKNPFQIFNLVLICGFFTISITTGLGVQAYNVEPKSTIFQDELLIDTYFESNGTINVGSAITKITPDLDNYNDIFLAGFDRNRKATGIHDDLWARCCCIKIGNVTIAFISVDLIGIMYHEYQSIIQSIPDDISIDQVLLTSTHNHEGPDVIGLWGKGFRCGISWDWYEFALSKITNCIIDAYNYMQPAGLRFGHCFASNFSRDSRNPKIMEEQVETLQFINTNQEIISTLVCYASHPEVLWSKNTLITSDYAHYLYNSIEEMNGGNALLMTGPIGGLITPNVSNHTYDAARLFGEKLANLSISSMNANDIIWETDISVKTKEIFIPMTNPLFRFASFLKILDRPLYQFNRCLLTSVSVVELGKDGSLMQMITVPGEDFPENWFEIKEKLHATHRIHIGLCNDELGYIVPYEQFDRTEYEESMSASKWLDPLIHQTIEDMLNLS